MACSLGIEQDCNECRMCGNRKGGKKMTNFERINGMNVEELAEFLNNVDICMSGEEPIFSCLIEDKRVGMGWNYEDIEEWLESECDAEC